MVGEILMSRLTFPSSLCLDKAGEQQSVGELEKSQGLLQERGHGKYSCFKDGAWDREGGKVWLLFLVWCGCVTLNEAFKRMVYLKEGEDSNVPSM